MNILIAVSGGIAAYKSLELTSLCKKNGHSVKVVLTDHATNFVTPLSFETLSGQPVITGMFDGSAESVDHITYAKWADILVIAPATANLIAKMALGLADDFLTTLLLAYTGPVMAAPAMNVHMYENEVFQRNLNSLRDRGVVIITPTEGRLACGDEGVGRMAEARDIFNALTKNQDKPLTGRRILVSAGPTREALDPVRFISNHSSGKMGYAIARTAREMGADVVLVSGPTKLDPPLGVHMVQVISTRDMYDAMHAQFDACDAVIMAAAPSDYRPATYQTQKIKKNDDRLILQFEKNPDILSTLGERKTGQVIVGFAAESENTVANAAGKCQKKNCDFIVANDITASDAGFNHDVNTVHIVGGDGAAEALPTMTKTDLAYVILSKIQELLESKENAPS